MESPGVSSPVALCIQVINHNHTLLLKEWRLQMTIQANSHSRGRLMSGRDLYCVLAIQCVRSNKESSWTDWNARSFAVQESIRCWTTEIQACLHNPDTSRFPQRRSKAHYTMEIQGGSHNGDPSRFPQSEIQAGSHNGDPNRFSKHITQWRSKAVHTTEIRAGSHYA